MEPDALERDRLWLHQHGGRKHDYHVFNDIVNRNVNDGKSEEQARIDALECMNSELIKKING